MRRFSLFSSDFDKLIILPIFSFAIVIWWRSLIIIILYSFFISICFGICCTLPPCRCYFLIFFTFSQYCHTFYYSFFIIFLHSFINCKSPSTLLFLWLFLFFLSSYLSNLNKHKLILSILFSARRSSVSPILKVGSTFLLCRFYFFCVSYTILLPFHANFNSWAEFKCMPYCSLYASVILNYYHYTLCLYWGFIYAFCQIYMYVYIKNNEVHFINQISESLLVVFLGLTAHNCSTLFKKCRK